LASIAKKNNAIVFKGKCTALQREGFGKKNNGKIRDQLARNSSSPTLSVTSYRGGAAPAKGGGRSSRRKGESFSGKRDESLGKRISSKGCFGKEFARMSDTQLKAKGG